MRIKKLLLSACLAMGAIGFVPAPAQAVDCLPEETVWLIGRNCWACGWVMISDRPYILFPCD